MWFWVCVGWPWLEQSLRLLLPRLALLPKPVGEEVRADVLGGVLVVLVRDALVLPHRLGDRLAVQQRNAVPCDSV